MFNKSNNDSTKSEYGITDERLDTFIDRVCKEKDETLYTLAQALESKLYPRNHISTLSYFEVDIYPLVIERVMKRLEKGEK